MAPQKLYHNNPLMYRVEQTKQMFFKWLVLGKGGVDDVGREPADSSSPTSSTPPLPSTSHLKNIHFFCSILYISQHITEKLNSRHISCMTHLAESCGSYLLQKSKQVC